MSSRSRKPSAMIPMPFRLAAASSMFWLLAVGFIAIRVFLFHRVGNIGGILAGMPATIWLLLAVTSLTSPALWYWAIRDRRARRAAGKTLEELQALSPSEFEAWVGQRFREQGYRVEVTGAQGDHGVDLILRRDGRLGVVQCKNYKAWSVGEPIVRDLLGAMHHFRADHGFLVTTGQLTRPAAAWVKEKPISVWDQTYVVALSLKEAGHTRPGSVTPGPGEWTTEAVELASAGSNHDEGTGAVGEDQPAACPHCGSRLIQRTNRRTSETFWGCARYPACRFTRPFEIIREQ